MDRAVLRWVVVALVGEVGFHFGCGIVVVVVAGSLEASDLRCMIVVVGCRTQKATGGA